jgi:hypothetical protein
MAMLLAGCAGALPPDAATVRVEPRQGVTQPLARGETELLVRAVPAAAPGQEYAGAACEAASPFFAARFTAPARVLMPDYGSRAPEVTVTCRAGGVSGSATAAPQAAWSGGLGGWPAVGVSVGTGDVSGVGVGLGWYGGGYGGTSGEPVARYPALRVPMQ